MKSLISFGTYYKYLSSKYSANSVPVANVSITKFGNRELSVSFKESLRGKHLFVFGETSENLTELLLTIDAANRSSVKEITVILPHYGYSRQDKREGNRGCLGASMIANVLQSMRIDRIITIDLHAHQIQGFFKGIPVEHINGKNIFLDDGGLTSICKKFDIDDGCDSFVVATPDTGGTTRALGFANALELPFVTINKQRDKPGSIKKMDLYGNVQDKNVLIIDDIADSCGTLVKAAELLKKSGALKVLAIVTHPVLSPKAKSNLEESINDLDGIIISDTLDCYDFCSNLNFKHNIVSCIDILTYAITQTANGNSLSKITDF